MDVEFYHQSIKFKKEELAYKKLKNLQNQMLDPTGNKYPLTSIIKMAIMSYENNTKD